MRTDDRLRRFEWALARDEQARSASELLRVRTHELLNLVQLVDLASQVILDRCGNHVAELVDDLRRAADRAREAVRALQDMAEAPARRVSATPVSDIARRVTKATVRVRDDVTVAWSPEELEMLLSALALDIAAGQLLVRDRGTEGGLVVEIVCGPVDPGSLAVRLARAVAMRAGGEVTLEPRRGGGTELVVTLAAT